MALQLNKFLRAGGVTIAALALMGGLAGCSGSGGGSAAQPQSPAIDGQYTYQVLFVDALTGAPITTALKAQVTGPSAVSGEVVDGEGVAVNGKSLDVTGGMLGLQVKKFDGTDDVFSVLGGNLVDGWSTSGVQILRESSKVGANTITVRLTNRNDAAKVNANAKLGMAMTTGTAAADATGKITTDITLSTADKMTTSTEGTTVSVGTATLSIPKDTVARDAAGNLASGNLNLTVTKFSNNELSSMSAFPGGFTVNAQTSATSTDRTTGNFVTGGFAQFNLTDSTGKAIKKFDTPITLTIDLPKGSKNATTGAVLKAGDTYPIWSFDELTGKWVFETDGTIKEKAPVDANNWAVSFQSKHLSYWNLDYFGPRCTGTLNVVRAAGDVSPLYGTAYGVAPNNWSHSLNIGSDSTVTLFNAPLFPVNVILKDALGVQVGAANNVNLCSGGSVTLTPSTTTYSSLTVNVSESCPDGTTNKQAKPSFAYVVYPSTWTGWQSGSTVNTGNVSKITFNGLAVGATVRTYTVSPFKYTDTTILSGGTTVNHNFNTLTTGCGATGATGGTGGTGGSGASN